MKKDVAISVRNMSKRFKLNSDKPHTLKERGNSCINRNKW